MMKKPLIALVIIAIISAAVFAWYRSQPSENGPLTLYGKVGYMMGTIMVIAALVLFQVPFTGSLL